MLHDSLIKLVKFIKHHIFIDVDKFIVPDKIISRMNPVLIYVRIFFRIIALLLNLNLSIFIISIILWPC